MVEINSYTEPIYRVNADKGIIIGRTEIMQNLFQYLNHLANLPTTVLLRGETGTGKELCAKSLHYNGKRKENHFVGVNCAGIPPELLESELFGYAKGGFTGAYKNTEGKFQYADGGTILLDEIGDMSPKLQAKVLRVLQERQVTKVGSNVQEKIDVRVVAATNKDLEEEVRKGNFREDLYYRLNVVPIKIPALRERREDIPLIAEYLIQKYNDIYGVQIDGLSDSAKEKLRDAEWKGNVRELENVIERIFVLRRDGVIDTDDLYFNSDSPIRIITKQQDMAEIKNQAGTKGTTAIENPSIEKRIEIAVIEKPSEETPKLWYQEKKILPVFLGELRNSEGSISYNNMMEVIRGGQVYSINLSQGDNKSKYLLCLDEESAGLFFNDTDTEDYIKLEKRIITSSFNEIAEEPFAFFGSFDLRKNPHTLKSVKCISSTIDSCRPYKIPTGAGFYFVITMEDAECYVRRGPGWKNNLDLFKASIVEFYEGFKGWKAK